VKDGSIPVTFSIAQRTPWTQRLSAESIMEAPWSGGVLPLADFDAVEFFDCCASVDGHTGAINDSLWQYEAITMETSDGTAKAAPSWSLHRGTGFRVSWGARIEAAW
jgi:hypothetical protein